MTRYPIGRKELLDLIHAARPTWIGRAKARTATYVEARDYTGGSEFWGEIKSVYIKLQHEKCAYCETKLQGMELASKVHEVEHFRPKQSVKAWPDPGLTYLSGFQPPCSMGKASHSGYYKLAYHPFNYAIACTRCNSTLKSNYFPIRGKRNVKASDPSKQAGENALLIYPLSDIDEDPTDLITFDGVLAVPRTQQGSGFERALTTIWFFQLNHQDLTSRRAEMLGQLYLNLETLRLTPASPLAGQIIGLVDRVCSPSGQFSACMRAYRALFESNHAAARAKGQLALQMPQP